MTDESRCFFGPETPGAGVVSAAISGWLNSWLFGLIPLLLGIAIAASTLAIGGKTRRVATGVVIGGLAMVIAGFATYSVLAALDPE